MKLLSTIKKYGKYLLGIAACATIVSQLVLPAISMRADQPRFNFLQGDHELFQGLNASKDETVWKDPVAGEAGDIFSGSIYYHNGMVDTVAENTKIKVSIPTQTTDGSAKLTATISADNADSVSDTIVDGQIIGLNGLTVNLDKDANIAFVPGSVKWYPNRSATSQALPFDQSGNEIVTSNGLNIGNIQGCWEYSGYITFAFRTIPKVQPPSLTISKTVRNVSKNQTNFSESVNAEQGDRVQFKIETISNGSSEATNVVISDQLPAELSVVSGSARLDKAGSISIISETALLSNGVNIGTLVPGAKATVNFEATAPHSITNSHSVINTAKVTSGNIVLTDTAQVSFEPGVVNIVKSKSAYNQTQSIDATTRAAGPGDTIEYTLVTRNTGNLRTDYVVDDGITDILEYADVISISDGGNVVDGPADTNEAKMVRYPSANIPAHGEIIRKFTIQVLNPLPNDPVNGFHFDDKMFNVYGNEILILIGRPTPPVKNPDLKIDKFVRNVTQNELDYVKLNTAFAGDTLEYKITFENVGNGPADYVKVYDLLPANVILDPSASAIISINGQENSIAENITNGYTIKTLTPGDKGYIRFRAITNVAIADNEQLKNTAFLDDHGKVISAEASTIIKQKIVPISQNPLPKTGASAAVLISTFASIFGTLNLVYLKQKKALYKAATSIKVW